MKLISIIAIAFVASQDSDSAKEATPTKEIVDKVAECFKEKNCGDDVNCKAKCVGVPSPDPNVVKKTDECYSECSKAGSAGLSSCLAKCDVGFINVVGSSSSEPSDDSKESDSNSTSAKNSTGSSKSGSSSSSSSSSPTKSGDARAALVPAGSLLASGLLAISLL
ncbi:hypothetical protein DSO57_1018456 [Entomophthora muscae]|uniref:Uncharacterized protein n=1 Tax=Entomophthora muscae TaxID=34485 RepID=A0ACC2RIT8_9FUNG|nr:hypothetical protein DSO57_1018456 [Entomophthora muscae]